MKEFIKEYLNIIAGAIIGFVFVLTSFYLVMNYYHYTELDKSIYIDNNDMRLNEYKETVNKIKNNLDTYSNTRKDNNKYENIYQNLSTCYNVMTAKDLYYKIETNRYYKPYDLYLLGGKFQSDVLNICWALHLSSIGEESYPKEVRRYAPLVKNNVKTIIRKTSDAMDELQNNSSYFFTTKITSATVRNYLTSDYETIVNSYQEFANIVLNLSNVINEGGNDDKNI